MENKPMFVPNCFGWGEELFHFTVEGLFLFMEGFFVYIIYSKTRDSYYRGYSTQPYKRLRQHNEGESRYTRNKGPWELVYLERFDTKRAALIREKSLKKYSKKQIRSLIDSPKNILENTCLSSPKWTWGRVRVFTN